jgi:VIT1/CCC1 family predicted Fe2+/Mn2+ transporter
LSGAVDTTRIIVTAGLAEIAAGSIAMGLGGYLAAKSDAEHYHAERNREETEVTEKPEAEVAEVAEVFRSYGLTEDESRPMVDALRKRPDAWVDFMMRFELGLEKPNPKRALLSAVTIAGAYIAGGFIPLGPYILLPKASTALVASVAINAARPRHVRICKRALYGSAPGPECHSDGAHRRGGRGSGLPDRPSNLVRRVCRATCGR